MKWLCLPSKKFCRTLGLKEQKQIGDAISWEREENIIVMC
jgi:hypothetical protein